MCLFESYSWNGNMTSAGTVCLVSYHIEQIIISPHLRLRPCVPRTCAGCKVSPCINTVQDDINQWTFLNQNAYPWLWCIFLFVFLEKHTNKSFHDQMQSSLVGFAFDQESKRSKGARRVTCLGCLHDTVQTKGLNNVCQ